MLKRFATLLFGLGSLAAIGTVWAQGKVQLTIESWRTDDLKIWRDTILPAFMKKNANIEVVFSPTAPTEYNAVWQPSLRPVPLVTL
jgi:raffinose/stachyose/melibiose transport system substrate-binding protein